MLSTEEQLGKRCCSHRCTYRIDNTAKPLEDEDRSPVVVQAVTFRRLYTHCHERFGFRLCACQNPEVLKKTQDRFHFDSAHAINLSALSTTLWCPLFLHTHYLKDERLFIGMVTGKTLCTLGLQ